MDCVGVGEKLVKERLEKQLRSLEQKRFGKRESHIHVIMVGYGYRGVELATTIA